MGILRFLLAIAVLASHSGGFNIPLPSGSTYKVWSMYLIDGRQSVVFFYIISGFYMAMILNSKYKSNLKFYVNRFLRLWPTYIVVLLLTCLLTPAAGRIIDYLSNCSVLLNFYVWFVNVFILGTDSLWLFSIHDCNFHYLPSFINDSANGPNFLINSPSFSISIEMIFYLMAPFILRSVRNTWVYFVIGVLYHFYFVITGNINVIYQYHIFPSSFLYFGLGALAWHYSSNLKFELSEKKVAIAFLICIICMFVWSLFPMVVVLIATVTVPALFQLTKHSKTDKLIGELSYPIYILHYPVLTYVEPQIKNRDLMGLWCLFYTLLFAVVIHFAVEKPIDKWRQRSINSSSPA